MKKIISTISASVGALVLPMVTFAQAIDPGYEQTESGLNNTLERIETLINRIVPLLIAIGFVYFVYGLIQYIVAKDEEKKKESRGVMVQGIVILFVILAIWGIVAILANALGIGLAGTLKEVPTVDFQG